MHRQTSRAFQHEVIIFSLSYFLLCGNEPKNFRLITAKVLQNFELSFPKDFDAKRFDASYKVCCPLSLNKRY